MPKASAKTLTADGGAVVQPMPATYEDAMRELELLVSQLESGALPLEEMLSGYQRGAQLLQLCRDRLQSVEDQIKVLDGGVLKPWSAQ